VTWTTGVLAIIWRIVLILLLILVEIYLRVAQKHDGEALKHLRGMILSFVLIFLCPTITAIDRLTDISPGFRWLDVFEEWIWLPYAVACTATVRFILSLHRFTRIKTDDKS
jgi:hypothetical protein